MDLDIHFLLIAEPGITTAKLAQQLKLECRRIDDGPASGHCLGATRLPPGTARTSAHDSATAQAPTGADGLLLVKQPTLAEARLFSQDMADRLVPVVDPARTQVFVGARHTILPGEGDILLHYPLRRKASLTRGAFLEHWRSHADFGRRMRQYFPSHSYYQINADEQACRDLANLSGFRMSAFDGIAESYFYDVAALERLLCSPAIAEDALQDEKTFIDHRRSELGLYEIVAS